MISEFAPGAEIVVVEPDGWDDMAHSLNRGVVVPVPPDAPSTLCDALQTRRVSPFTLNILAGRAATAVSVSDAEVAMAVRFAWEKNQLIVEPGGAAALAALLSGKVEPLEGTVVVLSGGNVDPAVHARIVGSA